MYELKKKERYLRVNLLAPGPRLIKKKNLPGCGLTKVEKHCYRAPEPSLGSTKTYSHHTPKHIIFLNNNKYFP